ncbi:MAG: EAL domain-containing protein [Zoogloea sp.]|nr:EAL domain-containing protein [Zoogloea sp.]
MQGFLEVFTKELPMEYAVELNRLVKLEMEGALRQALGRGQFRLHYQLQLDLKLREAACVEALVRWQHPEFGLLLPERFIPMAETLGLIDGIGSWVLENACRQWTEWSTAGCAVPRVAVNVSVRQLRHPDFVEHLLDILEQTGCPPSALELELTEGTLSEDTERTFAVLSGLREHGIRIAIDDFGTGYSSLSYLSRYPVDVVKIDRSFIAGLEHDPGARSVVQAIILLAHGLQMITVAEGVETPGQDQHLAALGCDCVQGFLFAQPVPPETLSGLLDQIKSRP